MINHEFKSQHKLGVKMLMDPMLLFFLDFSGFHMLFSDFLFYLGIMIFQSY